MRGFLKTLTLTALALGIGLALHWPPAEPARSGIASAPEAHDASGDFLTQLRRLEAAVEAQNRADRQRAGAFAEDLRTAAMRLSMAGPLAPLTQSTLIALSQRPALRQALFWLMPLVGWMSEPFLYPLPADADPTPRLQALIQARAAATCPPPWSRRARPSARRSSRHCMHCSPRRRTARRRRSSSAWTWKSTPTKT